MNNQPTMLPGTKTRISVVVAATALTVTLVTAGCADLGTDTDITDTVLVERIDSPRARITVVRIRDHEGQLKVTGRLKRYHRRVGRIPGHLHVDAFGPNGLMVEQLTPDYVEINRKLGIAGFQQLFETHPDQVSTVRVMHHLPHDA